MTHDTDTQADALLAELKKGPVTALQALDRLGIARCAARVFDLRKNGWDVTSRMVAVRNRHGDDVRVAEYRLRGFDQLIVPVHVPGRGRVSA